MTKEGCFFLLLVCTYGSYIRFGSRLIAFTAHDSILDSESKAVFTRELFNLFPVVKRVPCN